MQEIYLRSDYVIALKEVFEEIKRARAKFPEFRSPHEGYAILLEEVDELWEAIKSGNRSHAKREAFQVAAMAVCYIAETSEG